MVDQLAVGIFLLNRPATFFASKYRPALLILMSPFSSLKEVVTDNFGPFSILINDIFVNSENIKKVNCPTFILHGKKDYAVQWKHSKKLMGIYKK